MADAGLPFDAFQFSNGSGSSVSSAPMNGLPSPTTTACEIRAFERSRSSSGPGETFFPPAVTSRSFFRPVRIR